MSGTTIYDLHGRLLRDTFGRPLNDQDAFLVFVLFHGHRIVLTAPILTDRPGVQEVAAITQRHVSEALASLWGAKEDQSKPSYWYHRWNGVWGSNEHAYCLTPAGRERLEQLRAELERHPFVSRLEPED
jgi:hypothetical protein